MNNLVKCDDENLALTLNKHGDNSNSKTKLSELLSHTDFNSGYNAQALAVYRLIKSRESKSSNKLIQSNYKILSEIMSSKKLSIVKTKHDESFEQFQKLTDSLQSAITSNVNTNIMMMANAAEQLANNKPSEIISVKIDNENTSNRVKPSRKRKKKSPKLKKVSVVCVTKC